MSVTLIQRFNRESDPKLLMKLVICTFEYFEASGQKPGAERWTTNSHGRRQMVQEIVRRWVAETGCRDEECPWTADYMVSLWLCWRKFSKLDRFDLKTQLGLTNPEKQ